MCVCVCTYIYMYMYVNPLFTKIGKYCFITFHTAHIRMGLG